MTAQLLIYQTAVPLSKDRHKDWSVESGANWGFTKTINSVPLMAVEIPQASVEYAIVFAGEGEQIMPVVILGMRSEENLYLSEDGSWQAKYLPAFLRRYPFVFSVDDKGETFTLCIDEEFEGCNQSGQGQRVFDEDAKPTEYVDGVLNFLQEYQTQFNRTRAFGKKLQELDLLEPMHAKVSLDSGQRMSLTGFMAVDRKKLKELAPEKLAELAKTDELELVYLHLASLKNFDGVKDRLVAQQANMEPEPEAEAESRKKKKADTKG
jgi:hypothetical protein